MNRVHWPTIVSISASAMLITVLFHEAVHAAVCTLLGGDIRRFSAVHVNCACDADWKFRLVAASASIANLILAIVMWPLLRRANTERGSVLFFIWVFFSMNLFSGTGYWFASGLMGVGDWTAVIRGWEPVWLYRVGLFVLGAVSLMFAVAWTLVELGRILDGAAPKPISRVQAVGMVSYLTSFAVMLLVGVAQPGGPFRFPAIMSLFAVLGGFSPLLWMMQWFRADMFKVCGTRPLDIDRSIGTAVLAIALILIAIAATVLGQDSV